MAREFIESLRSHVLHGQGLLKGVGAGVRKGRRGQSYGYNSSGMEKQQLTLPLTEFRHMK